MVTTLVRATATCPYCWSDTQPRTKSGWPCLRCDRVLTQRELKLDKRSVVAHPLEATADDVARLLRSQREDRVRRLIDASMMVVEMGREIHGRGKDIVASAVLFSGGNDSTTLLHMMRTYGHVTHTVHANTGIGIEATRQFVRETSAHFGLPLIEKSPPPHRSYEALVLTEGFPGPAKHYKSYQWLKESALDLARVDLGVHRSRTKRALYIAGRRREESERRSDIPMFEADGSVIWESPMVPWTKLDLNTYRLMHPDTPTNMVPALIHHSGECGCGSFAKVGELEEWGDWFPDFRAAVERLEALIEHRTDIPDDRKKWGWGAYRGAQRPPRRKGRLCTSCVAPQFVA